MKTVTYQQIKNLATELAGRTRDKLPTKEATMLRAFFAAELVDIWNREAWPELVPDFEAITVASGTFSKREGAANEMGDILCIYEQGSPQTTNQVTAVEDWVEADDEVRLVTQQSTVYVEYQLPPTDLLDSDFDDPTDLDAVTLSRRFRLPLAWKGASHLLAVEDPALSNKYLALAEAEIDKQRGQLKLPWWRKAIIKR